MKKHDHIGNILAATTMVRAMPNDAFVPHLAYWASEELQADGPHACGAIGCFGGWIAVDKFFRAQGVHQNAVGQPVIVGNEWPKDISERLFGDRNLFDAREDHERGPEKDIILRRLKDALEEAGIQADV